MYLNLSWNDAAAVDKSDSTKKTEVASLKTTVDKLDVDELKKVLRGLNSIKSKVDKLDASKLAPIPVELN